MANEILYSQNLVKGTLYVFRRSGNSSTRILRYLEEGRYFIPHEQRVAEVGHPEPIESCYYTLREIFSNDGKGEIYRDKFKITVANQEEEHYYNGVFGLTLDTPRASDSSHYSIC